MNTERVRSQQPANAQSPTGGRGLVGGHEGHYCLECEQETELRTDYHEYYQNGARTEKTEVCSRCGSDDWIDAVFDENGYIVEKPRYEGVYCTECKQETMLKRNFHTLIDYCYRCGSGRWFEALFDEDGNIVEEEE